MYRGFTLGRSPANMLHLKPFNSITLLGQEPVFVSGLKYLFSNIRILLFGRNWRRQIARSPTKCGSGVFAPDCEENVAGKKKKLKSKKEGETNSVRLDVEAHGEAARAH